MQTIRATEKLQPGWQIVCKLCSMATSIYSTVHLLYKHQFPKITKVKQPKSAAGTWMGDRSSADVGAVKTGPQTSWGERKTFIFSLFIFCFFMFCVFYFETNPKLNVAKH